MCCGNTWRLWFGTYVEYSMLYWHVLSLHEHWSIETICTMINFEPISMCNQPALPDAPGCLWFWTIQCHRTFCNPCHSNLSLKHLFVKHLAMCTFLYFLSVDCVCQCVPCPVFAMEFPQHSKKKSTSEHLFWFFRLSQIEDSIQYLDGPFGP